MDSLAALCATTEVEENTNLYQTEDRKTETKEKEVKNESAAAGSMTEIYRQPKRRKLDQLIKREPESIPTLEERLAKVSESSEQQLQESSEKGAAMKLSKGKEPARENTTEKDTTSNLEWQQQKMKEIAQTARQTSTSARVKSGKRRDALQKIIKVNQELDVETNKKCATKKTVLDKMRNSGLTQTPFRVLYNCMTYGIKAKVWIRRYKDVRGVLTGYIVAFDVHMNLAMIDVDEVFMVETWMMGNPLPKKKKKKKKINFSLNSDTFTEVPNKYGIKIKNTSNKKTIESPQVVQKPFTISEGVAEKKTSSTSDYLKKLAQNLKDGSKPIVAYKPVKIEEEESEKMDDSTSAPAIDPVLMSIINKVKQETINHPTPSSSSLVQVTTNNKDVSHAIIITTATPHQFPPPVPNFAQNVMTSRIESDVHVGATATFHQFPTSVPSSFAQKPTDGFYNSTGDSEMKACEGLIDLHREAVLMAPTHSVPPPSFQPSISQPPPQPILHPLLQPLFQSIQQPIPPSIPSQVPASMPPFIQSKLLTSASPSLPLSYPPPYIQPTPQSVPQQTHQPVASPFPQPVFPLVVQPISQSIPTSITPSFLQLMPPPFPKNIPPPNSTQVMPSFTQSFPPLVPSPVIPPFPPSFPPSVPSVVIPSFQAPLPRSTLKSNSQPISSPVTQLIQSPMVPHQSPVVPEQSPMAPQLVSTTLPPELPPPGSSPQHSVALAPETVATKPHSVVDRADSLPLPLPSPIITVDSGFQYEEASRSQLPIKDKSESIPTSNLDAANKRGSKSDVSNKGEDKVDEAESKADVVVKSKRKSDVAIKSERKTDLAKKGENEADITKKGENKADITKKSENEADVAKKSENKVDVAKKSESKAHLSDLRRQGHQDRHRTREKISASDIREEHFFLPVPDAEILTKKREGSKTASPRKSRKSRPKSKSAQSTRKHKEKEVQQKVFDLFDLNEVIADSEEETGFCNIWTRRASLPDADNISALSEEKSNLIEEQEKKKEKSEEQAKLLYELNKCIEEPKITNQENTDSQKDATCVLEVEMKNSCQDLVSSTEGTQEEKPSTSSQMKVESNTVESHNILPSTILNSLPFGASVCNVETQPEHLTPEIDSDHLGVSEVTADVAKPRRKKTKKLTSNAIEKILASVHGKSEKALGETSEISTNFVTNQQENKSKRIVNIDHSVDNAHMQKENFEGESTTNLATDVRTSDSMQDNSASEKLPLHSKKPTGELSVVTELVPTADEDPFNAGEVPLTADKELPTDDEVLPTGNKKVPTADKVLPAAYIMETTTDKEVTTGNDDDMEIATTSEDEKKVIVDEFIVDNKVDEIYTDIYDDRSEEKMDADHDEDMWEAAMSSFGGSGSTNSKKGLKNTAVSGMALPPTDDLYSIPENAVANKMSDKACSFIFHSIARRLNDIKKKRAFPRIENKIIKSDVKNVTPLYETSGMKGELSSTDDESRDGVRSYDPALSSVMAFGGADFEGVSTTSKEGKKLKKKQKKEKKEKKKKKKKKNLGVLEKEKRSVCQTYDENKLRSPGDYNVDKSRLSRDKYENESSLSQEKYENERSLRRDKCDNERMLRRDKYKNESLFRRSRYEGESSSRRNEDISGSRLDINADEGRSRRSREKEESRSKITTDRIPEWGMEYEKMRKDYHSVELICDKQPNESDHSGLSEKMHDGNRIRQCVEEKNTVDNVEKNNLECLNEGTESRNNSAILAKRGEETTPIEGDKDSKERRILNANNSNANAENMKKEKLNNARLNEKYDRERIEDDNVNLIQVRNKDAVEITDETEPDIVNDKYAMESEVTVAREDVNENIEIEKVEGIGTRMVGDDADAKSNVGGQDEKNVEDGDEIEVGDQRICVQKSDQVVMQDKSLLCEEVEDNRFQGKLKMEDDGFGTEKITDHKKDSEFQNLAGTEEIASSKEDVNIQDGVDIDRIFIKQEEAEIQDGVDTGKTVVGQEDAEMQDEVEAAKDVVKKGNAEIQDKINVDKVVVDQEDAEMQDDVEPDKDVVQNRNAEIQEDVSAEKIVVKQEDVEINDDVDTGKSAVRKESDEIPDNVDIQKREKNDEEGIDKKNDKKNAAEIKDPICIEKKDDAQEDGEIQDEDEDGEICDEVDNGKEAGVLEEEELQDEESAGRKPHDKEDGEIPDDVDTGKKSGEEEEEGEIQDDDKEKGVEEGEIQDDVEEGEILSSDDEEIVKVKERKDTRKNSDKKRYEKSSRSSSSSRKHGERREDRLSDDDRYNRKREDRVFDGDRYQRRRESRLSENDRGDRRRDSRSSPRREKDRSSRRRDRSDDSRTGRKESKSERHQKEEKHDDNIDLLAVKRYEEKWMKKSVNTSSSRKNTTDNIQEELLQVKREKMLRRLGHKEGKDKTAGGGDEEWLVDEGETSSCESSVKEVENVEEAQSENHKDDPTMNVFQRRNCEKSRRTKRTADGEVKEVKHKRKDTVLKHKKDVETRSEDNKKQSFLSRRIERKEEKEAEKGERLRKERLYRRDRELLNRIQPVIYQPHPSKAKAGCVYKRRHANQLFIRGDNIVMIGYEHPGESHRVQYFAEQEKKHREATTVQNARKEKKK
ncbi:repetitive organellar protein-like isoform X2 [Hydractinia symbiolongicarpus]|uniref:repetitive organellar protein-like isoform X2 n=1 Tax=Hydractinia symbiolongicarpus TaxID=13093 RepID=UPI00254C34CB|nr:repetitive organellar protein-like isoform X2 [Hydractinia symbiolongicarpus]